MTQILIYTWLACTVITATFIRWEEISHPERYINLDNGDHPLSEVGFDVKDLFYSVA